MCVGVCGCVYVCVCEWVYVGGGGGDVMYYYHSDSCLSFSEVIYNNTKHFAESPCPRSHWVGVLFLKYNTPFPVTQNHDSVLITL